MARATRSTSTKPTRRTSAHPGFWMRSVQFAGLHRILHRVAAQRGAVRAKDLDSLIVEHGDYRVDRGAPSKTTLYHCRTTLLNLGALDRVAQRWSVAHRNPRVTQLLSTPAVNETEKLPRSACDAFSSLAVANPDCFQQFFRLFVPAGPVPAEEFRRIAGSAAWRSIVDEGPPHCELRSETSEARIHLTAHIQFRGVLYGVRDWACKQLGLLGEFHETGRGSVLFPLRHPDCADASVAVRQAMFAVSPDSPEWTTVSVADLLRRVCEREGYSVPAMHRGIAEFVRAHPGYVSLIATIANWATIAASTRRQADFHLETAYKDGHGRIISHLRFYNNLRAYHGQKNGKK